MNEIIIESKESMNEEILMKDMPRGTIGRIVSKPSTGTIVRRTCSEAFIVENLSAPGENCYWSALDAYGVRVVLLPHAKIIVKI